MSEARASVYFVAMQKNKRPQGIQFTKMHGIGNDFIVIDDLKSPAFFSARNNIESSEQATSILAHKLCDRHFGIGADQILWLKKPVSETAVIRMEIWNANGTQAEMCGNGVRAAALYVFDHHADLIHKATSFEIETLAGLVSVEIRPNRNVCVTLVVPKLGRGFESVGSLMTTTEAKREPRGVPLQIYDQSGDQWVYFFEVHVGNPHAVIFVDGVDAVPLERWGLLIETHPEFPNGTNVEFVEILNSSELKVRVWERGAGVTLACGSGACAVAAAAIKRGLVREQDKVQVHLPGGTLQISWRGEGAPIYMEGPAVEVFSGVYPL